MGAQASADLAQIRGDAFRIAIDNAHKIGRSWQPQDSKQRDHVRPKKAGLFYVTKTVFAKEVIVDESACVLIRPVQKGLGSLHGDRQLLVPRDVRGPHRREVGDEYRRQRGAPPRDERDTQSPIAVGPAEEGDAWAAGRSAARHLRLETSGHDK
jgi:hypothetical protein